MVMIFLASKERQVLLIQKRGTACVITKRVREEIRINLGHRKCMNLISLVGGYCIGTVGLGVMCAVWGF